MDLLLAICQAIGIGTAVGIGGPLTALFVATMAHVELGMDPEGTDWEFFASNWFIAVLFGINVAAFYGSRHHLPTRLPVALLAVVIGAVAGGASLAEQGEPAAIGVLLGAATGLAAGLLAGAILDGARARAEAGSGDAGTLTLIFAAAGIATAALALFLPPAALLAALALAVLAAGRRRRAQAKYEGLRVLR